MKKFNIWEGVYSSFDEVPSCGESFDSKIWLNSSEDKLLKKLSIPSSNATDSILPIVISILSARQSQINCLDFGGGLGLHYLGAKENIGLDIDLKYTVVDNKKSCEIANKRLAQYKDLDFMHSLPKERFFDIVYSSSAMQYINEWQDLIIKLLAYKPKFLIFNDLPAGDNKAFITHQNYYESKIPYRFYNLGEFIKYIESLNYKLIYKSNFTDNILGKYDVLPMDNFPQELRVGFSKNLIFTQGRPC